jgi:copper resistance protein B
VQRVAEGLITLFRLVMRLAVLLAVTVPATAVAGGSSWSAVVDLAEIQLRPTGPLHWESAVYRSLGKGRLHLEFDGDGQASSGIGGVQIQVLYEQTILTGAAVWVGGEHDIGASPWNALDVGACVQASDALYGETSLFMDSRGRAFHQVKIIAMQPIGRRLYLEPRVVLDSAFQNDRQRSMAAGPSALSLAVRLRLKEARGLAPYTGLMCTTAVGRSATWARSHAEDVHSCGFVFGFGANL